MSNQRPDPPRLAAIRERLKRATPGPWRAEDIGAGTTAAGVVAASGRVVVEHDFVGLADAEFIASAPGDIRALLADRDALLSDLRTLEAQWRERAERAVETGYYANNGRSQAFEDVADDLAALLARLEGK